MTAPDHRGNVKFLLHRGRRPYIGRSARRWSVVRVKRKQGCSFVQASLRTAFDPRADFRGSKLLHCNVMAASLLVTEVPRDASAILGAHLAQTSECSRNGPGQELVLSYSDT